MYSAILLAGCDSRKAKENYRKIVEKEYHEKVIYTGYKPLYEFPCQINGREEKKPLIQFTLESLDKNKLINEIIIVGFVKLIQKRLHAYLNTVKTKLVFVEQNAEIPAGLYTDFNIPAGGITRNSIGGNLIKGYAASAAYRNREMALFFASDTPFTTVDFINHVLSLSKDFLKTAGGIIPMVYFKTKKDRFRRPRMYLKNDTGMHFDSHTDLSGRIGLRVASLVLCNPFKIDVSALNVVYGLRKALSIKIQRRIYRICKNLSYPGIFFSYFIKRSLSILQAENVVSAFFSSTIKGVFVSDEKATYDFDGTESELKEITEILGHENASQID
ncbi:MAG: hypothetical protein JW874_04975 [Spirochaetales bacterium]|nr:hypothetical protein [Spirochaetales bacterium]